MKKAELKKLSRKIAIDLLRENRRHTTVMSEIQKQIWQLDEELE